MQDILISTSVNPFVLNKNDKGDLLVTVRNNDDRGKILSVEIDTGNTLSLTKGGLVRQINKPLGRVDSGKTISFYVDLHTMYDAKSGYAPVNIKVHDYLDETYKHVVRTFSKDINIRIA